MSRRPRSSTVRGLEPSPLTELTEKVGLTIVNLSLLKTGKAKAIRFTTLTAICDALARTPGEILTIRKR